MMLSWTLNRRCWYDDDDDGKALHDEIRSGSNGVVRLLLTYALHTRIYIATPSLAERACLYILLQCHARTVVHIGILI